MSKVEKVYKYLKYVKLLCKYILEQEEFPIAKEKIKTYKNNINHHMKKIKSFSEGEIWTDPDDLKILELKASKMTATFSRMIEYSEMRDDKDKISVESICSGIELHQNVEFMFLPDLEVPINSFWFIITGKNAETIAEFYDHMYFHALQFVVLMGGYPVFEDTQIPMTDLGSKIAGSCKLARYILNHSINTHKRIEDKEGATQATEKILTKLSSKLESHGVKDMGDISIEGTAGNPNIMSAVNEFKGDIKTMVDEKELTKDQLVDVSLGAFSECKKMGNNLPKDTQIMLHTFAAVCKEKAEKDTKLKSNRHAMKFIDDIIETYYDESLPIDEKMKKKMMKDLNKGKGNIAGMFGDIIKDNEKSLKN